VSIAVSLDPIDGGGNQSEKGIAMADNNSVELATELTIAWLGNSHNRIHADDVPVFLARMHEAIEKLTAPTEKPVDEQQVEKAFTPAVSVRKSLASPEHILSMIDGKPYRSLKRHLSTNGLTPDQYRQRYGLKADYPMVAPAYSEARRAMAVTIGLGRKAKAAAEAIEQAVAEPVEAVAKRARKSVGEAKKAAQAHLG
jgi:predicted transcriptional regulator